MDNIERLLKEDAKHQPPCDAQMQVTLLLPTIARESRSIRQARRRRREWGIMLGTGIPVVCMLALTVAAVLRESYALVQPLFMCFGLFSLFALLTLPLIEKFGAKRHGKE